MENWIKNKEMVAHLLVIFDNVVGAMFLLVVISPSIHSLFCDQL